MLQIVLNGTAKEVPEGTTAAALVEELGLRPEVVALEVNRALVSRAKRATTELREGDRVELVTLVGGG